MVKDTARGLLIALIFTAIALGPAFTGFWLAGCSRRSERCTQVLQLNANGENVLEWTLPSDRVRIGEDGLVRFTELMGQRVVLSAPFKIIEDMECPERLGEMDDNGSDLDKRPTNNGTKRSTH